MVSGYPPWHPKVGGGDIIGYKLSEALAKMGHCITYLAVADEPYRKKVTWCDFRYISEDEDFSSFSLEGDFDIIHVHNVIGLRYRTYKQLRKGKKCVIGLYAPLAHRLPRSMDEIFYRYLCKDAELILALSEFSKHNISSAYSIKSSKIEVMYAGVDDAFFENDKSSNSTLDKRGGQSLLKNRFHLLFAGRLNGKHQKGVDILLKAMPLILKEHQVVLDIIGDGPRLAQYKALARQLNIKSSVRFRGFIPHDIMPDEYANADLFVFPSRRESFGLVLAEAMASGLPVVSTTAGAIPEVVDNGETGILVPPDNLNDFARAVNFLLADHTRMNLMKSKGIIRAQENFTWEKIAQKILKFYIDLYH